MTKTLLPATVHAELDAAVFEPELPELVEVVLLVELSLPPQLASKIPESITAVLKVMFMFLILLY